MASQITHNSARHSIRSTDGLLLPLLADAAAVVEEVEVAFSNSARTATMTAETS